MHARKLATYTDHASPKQGMEETACPVCHGVDWRFRYKRQGWDFVKCKECGLIRLAPMPTEQELDEFYTHRAEHGNYELGKVSERHAGLIDALDFAERVCPAPHRRVFDFGCFDGAFLDLAATKGWESWGLELQGPAAAVAKSRHPNRVYVGTVEAFEEIRAGYFDLVTGLGLIEHLRQPERLFEIAREMLRPGGVIVIQTPNLRSMPARLLGRYWPPIAAPEHTHYLDAKTLNRLCERYGFQPVASKWHWKRLRSIYIYNQFQYFGPEFRRAVGPLVRILPRRLTDIKLPVYGGEMLYAARRIPDSMSDIAS